MTKPLPNRGRVMGQVSHTRRRVALGSLFALGGCATASSAPDPGFMAAVSLEQARSGANVPPFADRGAVIPLTRDELVARLKKAGELVVLGADEAEIESYFNTSVYRFHGPDGFETDFTGIANYFRSIRAAFDDRSIRRGVVVVDENYIACQTLIEGRFVREFGHSPVGALPPNGQRVVWDLINIFTFDDHGRLTEEWVQTDFRSFLRQLGAGGR